MTREEHCRSMATHNMRNSIEYPIWVKIKLRCTVPDNDSYPRYGGRGIKVCERWSKFENFFADMGPRPSKRHSIDRIDTNGDYELGNCRWATPIEQSNNNSKNRIVEYRGQRMTLAQSLRAAGNVVNKDTARLRLNRGWSVERAVEQKAGPVVPSRSARAA